MASGETMLVPDVKRLAAEISVQHGIRVDPDDPMMAVVTLNRLVLEQAIGEIVEQLQAATHNLEDAAEKVQLRAGARLAREVRDCIAAVRAEQIPNSAEPARLKFRPDSTTSTRRATFPDLLLAVLLFLTGVWMGIEIRKF